MNRALAAKGGEGNPVGLVTDRCSHHSTEETGVELEMRADQDFAVDHRSTARTRQPEQHARRYVESKRCATGM